MILLGIVILIYCLVWFALLWRREYAGSLILSPFLLFSLREIFFVWPATFIEFSEGMYGDGYLMLLAGTGFFFFLVGFSMFRKHQVHLINFSHKKVETNHSEHAYIMGILVLTLFLVAIGLFHYQGLPPIIDSITVLTRGDVDVDQIANEASAARLNLTKGAWFGGAYRGQGIIRQLTLQGWPFLLIISLSMFHYMRKRVWLMATLALSVPTFVFIAGDTTRGPLMWALIQTIAGLSLIRKISLKTSTLSALAAFLILIGISFTSSKAVRMLEGDNPLAEVSGKLVHRVFLGNGLNNLRAVDFIRSGVIRHRWGQAHLEKTVSSLPGVRYGTPFAHELYMLVNPSGRGTTLYSSTYLSMLYLDFSWWGIIFGYFLMGVLIGLTYPLIYNRPKTVRNVILASFAAYFLSNMSNAGPIGLPSFVAMFIVLLVVYYAGLGFHVFMERKNTPVFNQHLRPMPVKPKDSDVPKENHAA